MRISFQGRTLPRSRLAERSGEPRPAGRHSVHRERQWLGKRGFARIAQAAAALEAAGLVREIDAAGLVRPIDQVGRGELQ
jgi:hypothetical protein